MMKCNECGRLVKISRYSKPGQPRPVLHSPPSCRMTTCGSGGPVLVPPAKEWPKS